MRHLVPLLLLATLLQGCSQRLLRGDAPTEAVAQPGKIPLAAAATITPAEQRDRELMYLMLVGEFAEQQGDYLTATKAFLRAARLSDDPQLARQATRVGVFSQDYDLVQEGAELWVTLDEKDLDARQSLAALLLRNGETERARVHLEKIIELAGPEQGFGVIGSLFNRQPDKEQGLALLRELVAPWPKQREAHFALAQVAAGSNHYQHALQALDRVERLSPNWPKALILRANILNTSGDVEGAIDTLERTVPLLPNDYSLRLSYARLLVQQRHFAKARQQYAWLARELPGNGDVLYAVSLLALQSRDLGLAERYLRQLLKLDGYSDKARFMLGQIAEERGRAREAIDWYQHVGAGEHYLDSRFRVADLIAASQGLQAGRGYLKSVVVLDPVDEVRIAMADAELVAEYGTPAEALKAYDAALLRYPDEEDLLYARAMAGERAGRLDILERDLQQILHKDPDNARALNALGFTLADTTERYAEAERYIERAYKLAPEDAAVVDSMGWVQHKLGRHEKAVELLSRALQMLPDGEIAAHLGEALWAAGRRVEARKVLDAARREFPDSPILKRTLKRLGL